MTFKLASDYIDVAARIAEFRNKYPDGSLQQESLQFVDFAGTSWVVYTASAYRTPDDQRPGQGTAWEPVPGKTPYTKDSEVQNAETAAWGRAIVATLAADTKKGIASAEEVRNRQDAQATEPPYQVVPDVGKAVKRLESVSDLSELERLQDIADGYYESDAWTDEVMDEFNSAAQEVRARLESARLL